MRVKGQKSGVMRIFQALLVSYIVTGILLLVLAVLLYKLNLDKGKVTAGITGIYVVSAFAGGFLIGKLGTDSWNAIFSAPGTGVRWCISHPSGRYDADCDNADTVRGRRNAWRNAVVNEKKALKKEPPMI